jgi:hypothetical protein
MRLLSKREKIFHLSRLPSHSFSEGWSLSVRLVTMGDDVQDHRISSHANRGDHVRWRALAEDVVAQFYQAHRSKHDPLDETQLLSRYFDAELLKLYLKDKREAKGEVGRLDGDPLYNAQEIQITDFSISAPKTTGGRAERHTTR